MRILFAVSVFGASFFSVARAQQTDPAKPVVVQPGVPGAPSKTLPSSTRAILPPRSKADVEFMQGMILPPCAGGGDDGDDSFSHAKQRPAVIGGAYQQFAVGRNQVHGALAGSEGRIGSEGDAANDGHGYADDSAHDTVHDTSHHTSRDKSFDTMALMPGMLTPQQMDALQKAKGAEFDHLFLTGMIQHHNGALTMVKDLFDTAGAGQDAEIFNFATDADNTQRAEIRIMETMLKKQIPEEKR